MEGIIVGERQILVKCDASNRTRGQSPTKPNIRRQPSLALYPTCISDADTTLHMDYIGMHAVNAAEEDEVVDYEYTITSHRSVALLLGRARNAAEEEAVLSEPSADQSMSSTPIRRVSLPLSARHVSRDHAVIFHSPFGSAWAVKILGQNGLFINGKRRKAGVVLKLIPYQSTLDFFGVKCLFVGSRDEDISPSRVHTVSIENGHSPLKRATLSSLRYSIGSETTSQVSAIDPQASVSSPLKKKLVGNPLKRPLGAPPSPPTSSPVRFNQFSSPTKGASKLVRHYIQNFSPVQQQNEEEGSDQTSDEESDARGGSPSLSRRGAKADDSGMAFEVDSADEASQALRRDSSNAASLQPESEAEICSGPDEDRSRRASPAVLPRRKEKRVKFVAQDNPRLQQVKEKSTATLPLQASITTTALPYFQQIQGHLRSQVALLAETYDLQGLLAQAIVFHRTATISATEAVRSVLSSTPGLLRGEVGPDRAAILGLQSKAALSGWSFEEIADQMNFAGSDELDKEKVELWQKKAWREKLEECLMEGDCFGIISRAGKDASGNPLECWYYYDKEGDTDLERAANLGSLAKPMRAALKTHKPIFWKKSAYGDSSEAQKMGQVAMASESQWGSSGSTLDSLLFSRGKIERGTAPPLLTQNQPNASSSSWEETQHEEREKTWDPVGDDDFEMRVKKVRRRR